MTDRDFPRNTCPASRHVEMIADALEAGRPYPMLTEDPEHCGGSMRSVVESLWAARTRIAALEAEVAALSPAKEAAHAE